MLAIRLSPWTVTITLSALAIAMGPENLVNQNHNTSHDFSTQRGIGSFGTVLSDTDLITTLPGMIPWTDIHTAFGDLNGDGITDIACIATNGSSAPDKIVFVLLNDGMGNLSVFDFFSIGPGGGYSQARVEDYIALADMDDDDDLDIVITGDTVNTTRRVLIIANEIPQQNPPAPADLNNDSVVNSADLAELLAAWGPTGS